MKCYFSERDKNENDRPSVARRTLRIGMHDEIFYFKIFKNFKYFKTAYLKYFIEFLIFIIKRLKTFKNMIKYMKFVGNT